MDMKNNIYAILKTIFPGYKDELIDTAVEGIFKVKTDELIEIGRNEAWETVKKIDDLSTEKFEEIFGSYIIWTEIFNDYSASEAIGKIREYEMKENINVNNDFWVGDEVKDINTTNNRIGVVTRVSSGIIYVCFSDGSTGCWSKKDFVKTGRNFQEIKRVLNKLK